MHAQKTVSTDSVQKNMIGFSVLPVLSFLSGSYDVSQHTNFNLSYRRNLSKSYTFRSALIIFPKSVLGFDYPRPTSVLYTPSGAKPLYYGIRYGGSPKAQLNVGFSKTIRSRIFDHSIGAEAFVNHYSANYDERYFYYRDSLYPSGNIIQVPQYLDGYGRKKFDEKETAVGLHLLYNLGLKLTKHWYLSATAGISGSVNFNSRDINEDTINFEKDRSYAYFQLLPMPLLSDFSICYRW